MRTLMLLALPLLLVSCDSKEEAKPHDHSMHDMKATSADQTQDPVCKMMIDRAKATKHAHEGADYFFCSETVTVSKTVILDLPAGITPKVI